MNRRLCICLKFAKFGAAKPNSKLIYDETTQTYSSPVGIARSGLTAPRC